MDFALTPHQEQRRLQGRALGRDLAGPWTAADVVQKARAIGFDAPAADGIADVLLVEAVAAEAVAPAVALALHTAVVRTWGTGRIGDRLAAVALTSEPIPTIEGDRLHGRASWLAPVSAGGVAVVGARREAALTACLVALDAPGVSLHAIEPSGLDGLPCAHVDLDGAVFVDMEAPQPVMAVARLLLAAVGLGIARRALREALRAATQYGRTGPGGEQTLHGLIADVATELEAAMVVAWDASLQTPVRLAQASMAKLLATEAAQRAVLRATQVVGVASFEHGHVLERLSHDVRALELFAGRTEALREAVADQVLPRA